MNSRPTSEQACFDAAYWLDEMRGEASIRLVERIAEADHGAFSDFYDLTSARVFGIVRALVPDVSLSEQLTREIFLEFWKNAPQHAATFEPLRSILLFTRTWVDDALAAPGRLSA
ncbi:hypothetical protein KPL76_01500 [Subtercola sp. PAMC28395]|uniref:hypothetical protein n=1 Tax=Subtercola sp. PAMC28395 TaxID=2846775 RepID=UPI001C0D95BA|nr:hypothetical protein [Subtercola sp. PAMC28395]QWT24137.1 hypothetical protein KPL76_01500 [Subtercola sp. PAMC28395]